MIESGKVHLNVLQARRLADLLNKADWHANRGRGTQAEGYFVMAREVLKGVIRPDPDGSPMAPRMLYDAITNAELRSIPFGQLRNLSLLALEEIEKSLYVPRGSHE